VGSLRVRLAVLVAAVSLVVLALAGWGVVLVVEDRVRGSVRDEAVRAVERAVATATAGRAPEVGPGGDLGEPEVRVLEHRLRTDGTGDDVTETGDAAAGGDVLEPFGGEIPEIDEGEVVVVEREVDGVPAYLAFSSGRDAEGRRFTLGAAASLRAAEATIATFRRATLAAVPALALVLAGLAAVVAGRVLRPVATMRAEADAVSHGTLHRRLTPTTRSSELAALAATMNDMLDRLERSATAQRRLVADVSHELRSPLATIRANLELAGSDQAVALAEVDRLEDVVSDLLTLSRLDEAAPARTEDLDLEDVVAAQAAAVARRPGVRIDTAAVAPARLHGDRRAVVGLVRNLLDNAVRHARSTVVVTVEPATGEDGPVVLIVDDDGPGIPPDQRRRVFERFARLDEGRSRDVGGAGLGLAVVAAAAHAQGGTATAGDAPGGGARLRVVLPVRPSR
jgi:signal transduction histidine kinase